MNRKENNIQKGVSSIFESTQEGHNDANCDSRLTSQRKFFLTGRRSREPRNKTEAENVRTSLMMNRRQYSKVKEIAIREGLTIKDLLFSMIELAIEAYERKHGVVVVSRVDKPKNLFK